MEPRLITKYVLGNWPANEANGMLSVSEVSGWTVKLAGLDVTAEDMVTALTIMEWRLKNEVLPKQPGSFSDLNPSGGIQPAGTIDGAAK